MKQIVPSQALVKVVGTDQIFRAVDADAFHLLLAEITPDRAEYSCPLRRLGKEVEAEIARGEIEILKDDPYLVEPPLGDDRENITKAQREKEQRFDERCEFAHSVVVWMLIEAGIHMGDKAVYRMVTKIAARKFKVHVTTCRRWLSIFWRNGCTKHGMRAEYRSGPRADNAKKPGRKARPGKEGKKLTESDKEQILAHYGATRGKGWTNEKTWWEYLKEYHRDGIDGYNPDGEPIIIHERHDKCPSRASWLGVVYLHKDFAADLEAEHGDIKYKVRFRPKPGSFKASTFGPLSRVEIDFTVGSQFLLARNRLNVLGKPVKGVAYDVFSSAIIGIISTWEHASEMTLRLLMENVMSDKVAFCKRYGVTITPGQWPMCYIPIHCVFDRGSESKFTIGNEFPEEFGFGWENVPTGDPTKKPSVESNFAKMERLAKARPGWEPQYWQRGDEDAAKTAMLTMDDDMEIFIKDVLHHNNSELETRYIHPAAFAAGCRTPTEVFLWGMEHRAGLFKIAKQETLRWRIVPPQKAVLNGNVLLYKGLEYYSEELVPILVKARKAGWTHVTIRRNQHKVDEIYYRPNPKTEKERIIVCSLTPRFEHLKGMSFDEVALLDEQKKLDFASRSEVNRNKDIAHDNTTQYVVDRATKLTAAARKAAGLGKTEYDDSDKRNNRKDEAHERSEENFNGVSDPASGESNAASPENGNHPEVSEGLDKNGTGEHESPETAPQPAVDKKKSRLKKFLKKRNK